MGKLTLPGASLLTGGIQQAGGIISGIIGNIGRRKAADTAYRRNIEQWERQNKYNDPSQQMARLKAAGLNPAMMQGQGTQAAGNAATAPAAPVQKYENIPIADIPHLSRYQDVKNAQQTEQLIRQKIRVEMEVEQLKALEATGRQLTNEEQEIKNLILDGWGMNMKSAEYQSLLSGTKLKDAQTDESLQRARNLKVQKRLAEIEEKIQAKNWQWFDTTGIRPNDPLWAKMLTQVITKFSNEVAARGKVTMADIRKEFSQAEIDKLTPAEMKILTDLINAQ